MSGCCWGLGWLVDDVEVEQHRVGAHERGPVVPPALPGRSLAGPARVGERIQVADGQLLEWAAGLDQQPPDGLRRGPLRLSLGEPDRRCGVAEPAHAGLERRGADLAPEARQLARHQPVPARPQPPVGHQEHQQRHRRGRQRQPGAEGLVGPGLRVGPAVQERPGRPLRRRVPPAAVALAVPPRPQQLAGCWDRRRFRCWRVGGGGQHRTRP